MANGYSEKDMSIRDELSRHDEQIKELKGDYCKMEKTLQKIYFLLATIAGGVITSLILLVINLKTNGG